MKKPFKVTKTFSNALMVQSDQKQQNYKIHLSSYNTWDIQLWSRYQVEEEKWTSTYSDSMKLWKNFTAPINVCSTMFLETTV